MTGRPRSKFCWDNVTTLSNGKWKCNYCKGKGDDDKERSGGAKRIRNHLSGEGKDVGACKYVPPHIREEALRISESKSKGKKKSKGKDDDGVNDMAPRSLFERGEPSNIPDVAMPTVNNGSEAATPSWHAIYVAEGGTISDMQAVDMAVERDDLVTGSPVQVPPFNNDVADAFVKFLLSRNVSADILQDSHFRTFLERVVQYGCLPSSLLQENPSFIIPKSLWNTAHEFTRYMEMVKESWKETGCTSMIYDFDEGKSNPVLGFYCPKGFIFVEVEQSANQFKLAKTLDDHVLNLSMGNVIRYVDHFPSHISKCRYQSCTVTNEASSRLGFLYTTCTRSGKLKSLCVRHQIEKFYGEICEESECVESLIKRSKDAYQYIVSSNLYGKYYKTLKKERVEQFVDGKHASSFSLLRSIMAFEQELKDHEINRDHGTDISEIMDEEFWFDGYELLDALEPLSKIPTLMDTLVPTVGYLYTAIYKAKRVLNKLKDGRWGNLYAEVWPYFESWVTEGKFLDPHESAAAYLSPACPPVGVQKWDFDSTDSCMWELKGLDMKSGDEQLNAEIRSYNSTANNPFTSIPLAEREGTTHPVQDDDTVILWEKYGSKFPLLQKCAIKLFSQPASCLCDQVKKHMSQLQGTDNYVLRLNYKMMEEFQKLENDIYKPILF